MNPLTPADPETKSPDFAAENLSKLMALFPELVTEGKDGVAVNVDVLKTLVGDRTVTDAEEKYGLNWHGKRAARQIALSPSTGTLRPCPEESVDWESTKNLMIEGDNLEVLKLLQKSYAGKVKLIYIDPPYNTGKDFVYPDNFQDNIKNYLELTGQTGEGGRKLSSNTEASGRFHTDWLNMMYPRLKLARNLLQKEGVIWVSACLSWPAATSARGSRTGSTLQKRWKRPSITSKPTAPKGTSSSSCFSNSALGSSSGTSRKTPPARSDQAQDDLPRAVRQPGAVGDLHSGAEGCAAHCENPPAMAKG